MGPQPGIRWAKDEPVSRIDGPAIVLVPVIKAAGKTFRDRLKIELQTLTPSSVYYTTDGSQPTAKSTRFVKPFVIDRDSTVIAIAIDGHGNRSFVVTAA
jgi:hypothetical protein